MQGGEQWSDGERRLLRGTIGSGSACRGEQLRERKRIEAEGQRDKEADTETERDKQRDGEREREREVHKRQYTRRMHPLRRLSSSPRTLALPRPCSLAPHPG